MLVEKSLASMDFHQMVERNIHIYHSAIIPTNTLKLWVFTLFCHAKSRAFSKQFDSIGSARNKKWHMVLQGCFNIICLLLTAQPHHTHPPNAFALSRLQPDGSRGPTETHPDKSWFRNHRAIILAGRAATCFILIMVEVSPPLSGLSAATQGNLK